jgi:hypothetical protein
VGSPGASARFARDDYYRVLQVDPGAHHEIIAAAYRTLLRALGKHPDLGGAEDEAKLIIEAYGTLNDPARRRAYDGWLRAHSAVMVPPETPRTVPLSQRLTARVRGALPGYRVTTRAPFARTFDTVLEGPGAFAPRVYVKAYSLVTRVNWPTIFVLCKALRVARHGTMPSTDLLLVTAGRIDEADAFVEAAGAHTAPWTWNRLVVGVQALSPSLVHLYAAPLMPRAFHRLRDALAVAGRTAVFDKDLWAGY